MNPVQPALAAAALALAANAAEENPLWEVGAGAGVFTFPAYRDSDKNSTWVLPVHYFTYHGDCFKADRLDRTINAFLAPPSGSDNIPARAGMPDLKAALEIGPQVDLTLWRLENRARFVKLRMPLRAAFTVDRTLQDVAVSWLFNESSTRVMVND